MSLMHREPALSAGPLSAGPLSLEAWLVRAGLAGQPTEALVDEFAARLCAEGIPLKRIYVGTATLHPLVRARGYTWLDGQGLLDNEAMLHREPDSQPQIWLESPFRHMLVNDVPELRRPLVGADAVHDFPVLGEFAGEGYTEWLGLAYSFGWDLQRADEDFRNPGMGMISSFLTAAPGGYSPATLARLRQTVPLLALAIKSATLAQLARDVTASYIGGDAASHVLSGEIRRGMAQKIDAVILYADLRGFTAVADRLAIEPLVAMLNEYFDCLGPAIEDQGGQILKYLGDGLLASFQLADGQDPAPLCAAALTAAERALAAVDELNTCRRAAGQPALDLDIALHRGTVMYGNVGTRARLDFTLIGPAVNEASRLENLCSLLDRNLVASRSFAVSAGGAARRLQSLGLHPLRGVTEPQEVFGLED
ncbi:adenylate/guanylate cyclase domain-containing protein [Ferrovibrio xuzhouensis]|uniref:Adenylate/guanylate cyclase domain-containing protein n=1 Tax=Ferrovibrio xuzhouensis TaxID=1576914 RepID=A0ABV7VIM6_9PROT